MAREREISELKAKVTEVLAVMPSMNEPSQLSHSLGISDLGNHALSMSSLNSYLSTYPLTMADLGLSSNLNLSDLNLDPVPSSALTPSSPLTPMAWAHSMTTAKDPNPEDCPAVPTRMRPLTPQKPWAMGISKRAPIDYNTIKWKKIYTETKKIEDKKVTKLWLVPHPPQTFLYPLPQSSPYWTYWLSECERGIHTIKNC